MKKHMQLVVLAVTTVITGLGNAYLMSEATNVGITVAAHDNPTNTAVSEHLAVGKEEDTADIELTAKHWDFSEKEITLKAGQPVKISIHTIGEAHGDNNDEHSHDMKSGVEHSFTIDELGIDEKLRADETSVVQFTPTSTGTYMFYCNIPCGNGHERMRGVIRVI